MIPPNATTNRRGRFQRGMAALGTSAALVGALVAQTMGIAPAHAATSPAATYTVGISLAHDEFNRTGTTLGSAFVGGRWETASPTGLLRLQNGAATWSAFTRGQTTHAWLPEVSAPNAQVDASFAFGLISRTLYGMSHRTVVRRQINGDGYVTSAAVLDNGQVSLSLSRVSNRVSTTLAGVPVAATLTSNQLLNVQTRVVGSRRVHLVARVWVAGTPRPDWQITYADSSPAAITTRGAVGVNASMGQAGSGRSVTLTRFHTRRLVAPATTVAPAAVG
jgi:hypothetical protein